MITFSDIECRKKCFMNNVSVKIHLNMFEERFKIKDFEINTIDCPRQIHRE